MEYKFTWFGTVLSVQPRIRLLRSFDEVSHHYSGYILRLKGSYGGEELVFTVGIGKAAHAKFQFQVGDKVSGEAAEVLDSKTELANLYKASKFKVLDRRAGKASPPPWNTIAPGLDVYRERGHRRLDAKTYQSHCSTCIWGCLMPVEMIIDHWKPDKVKYRTETFCYGPLSCKFYAAGPVRKVPGRNGMVHVEENWMDRENVSHRGPDD